MQDVENLTLAESREALRLEASLARLRSRAMDMESSGDIGGTALALFAEVLTTVPQALRAGIMLRYPDDVFETWLAIPGPEGETALHRGRYGGTDWPEGEGIRAAFAAGQSFSSVETPEFLQWVIDSLYPGDAPLPIDTTKEGQIATIFPSGDAGLFVISLEHLDADPAAASRLWRFAETLGIAFRRYRDLKRAEAQALEAQIEAAVERVRGKALAMRRSEEIQAVAVALRKEFLEFGLEDVSAATIYLEEGADHIRISDITEVEGSDSEASLQMDLVVPMSALRGEEWFWEMWKPGPAFRINELDLTQLYGIEGWLRTVDEEKADDFKAVLDAGDLPHLWQCVGALSRGRLVVEFVSAPPELVGEILPRMTSAFDLAYQRFQDLRTAEAQARHAQVEAAVERVRGKARAMRRSEDVNDVSVSLREEMLGLGITGITAGSVFLRQTDGRYRMWDITTLEDITEGAAHISDVLIDLDRVPPEVHLHEVLGFSGPFRVVESGPEELLVTADWFGADYNPTLGAELREAVEIGAVTRVWFPAVPIEQGRMSLDMVEEPPTELEWILPRFASAFELAYQRFEDLRLAEAQARESQIEASVERIRGRAMAMQRSEDVYSVAAALKEEMSALGITGISAATISVRQSEGVYRAWDLTTFEEATQGRAYASDIVIDLQQVPEGVYLRELLQFVEPYRVVESGREELLLTADWFGSTYNPSIGNDLKEAVEAGVVTRLWFPAVPIDQGRMSLDMVEEPPAELEQILPKVASAFELAYRRFEDLQHAEQQAREARVEAALQRVRAEIATMRTSEDLERITPTVWRELESLGVPFDRCGVFIMDEESELTRVYLSRPDGSPIAAMQIPFSVPGLPATAVTHWRGREVFTDVWDRQQLEDWSRTMTEGGYVEEGYLPSLPDQLALHFVPFDQGILYVGSAELLAAKQVELTQALADAFSVAYARYDDFRRLEAAKAQADAALAELRATQRQMVEQEKLASLGQLTAGIAHEIKNPLNFVNNFAEVSAELADEAREALRGGDVEAARVALADLEENSAQIAKHGKRADDIVKAMMQHARGGDATRESVDFNAFVDEYVNLAWHGMRARKHGFNVDVERDFDAAAGNVDLVPQEFGRVLVNLLNNAFDALANTDKACVTITTGRSDNRIALSVVDNGPGIPANIRDRIFEPFFTTKPTGQGTGLGLSLSYDIVTKVHGGSMTLSEGDGGGAAFLIELPQ